VRASARRDLRSGNTGRSRWHLLLLLPVLLGLSTPLFNRTEPQLGGVPFFYWGQLALIVLATFVTAIAHVLTKRVGRP
jgi:hypothetical protein